MFQFEEKSVLPRPQGLFLHPTGLELRDPPPHLPEYWNQRGATTLRPKLLLVFLGLRHVKFFSPSLSSTMNFTPR